MSYAVSLELAKTKKLLSYGEIVKQCAVEMVTAFGDGLELWNSLSVPSHTDAKNFWHSESCEGKAKTSRPWLHVPLLGVGWQNRCEGCWPASHFQKSNWQLFWSSRKGTEIGVFAWHYQGQEWFQCCLKCAWRLWQAFICYYRWQTINARKTHWICWVFWVNQWSC